MIDITQYKRAVQWLERRMAEQARGPDDEVSRFALLQSFEVTYNVTETILRQALSQLSDDPNISQLSSRELMRYAVDEGLPLVSAESWLQYGLALERANATFGEAFSECVLPLLPQYAQDIQIFATRLEERLVPVA